ncbi:MAG: TonB family protein [Pseudomonadota bacterium]
MNTAVLPRPSPITAADRLGLTVFFAAVLHAILILGISIHHLDFTPLQTAPQTLEITLVTRASEKKPEQADFLAQAHQEGGGNVEAATPPPSPPPPPSLPAPEISAPAPEVAVAPPKPPKPQIEEAPPESAPPPKKQAASKAKKEVMTQRKSAQHTAPASEQAAPPTSAAQLIGRSMEIASLSAQVNDSMQTYAQRPRQKFISAKTQEYKYAAYMEAWRIKVERIGNLNYPDEAKRHNLSGSLILDVAINANGTLNSITLRRPSGEKILDEAAMRIVKLAAPYAPFPDEIRKETDILHITRTWQFLPGNRLSGK